MTGEMTTEEIVKNAEAVAELALERSSDKVKAVIYFDNLVRVAVAKNFPRDITVELALTRKKMLACLSEDEKSDVHYISCAVEHALKVADYS